MVERDAYVEKITLITEMWLHNCTYLDYYLIGCRAFGIFIPEVFEQAMRIFKILNTSGNTRGFVRLEFHVCDDLR